MAPCCRRCPRLCLLVLLSALLALSSLLCLSVGDFAEETPPAPPYGVNLSADQIDESGASYLSNCQWDRSRRKNFEVLWINLDKSSERRDFMQKHLDDLGFTHHRRFRALSIEKDIYIPPDIEKTWNTPRASTNSSEYPPSKGSGVHIPNLPTYLALANPSMSKDLESFSIVIKGLFGRRKGNRLKELGCTVSHMMAMREAIFFNKTDSKFALIIEDDVTFPFEIDFDALVASAPTPEWGILQLFNSNEETMENSWFQYEKDPTKNFWIERYPKMAKAYWSTCAYLINREVMRPVIEKLAVKNERTGWVELNIIAGTRKPCGPMASECCVNRTIFQDKELFPICIDSPRGFQADSYLYATTRTFVLHPPLITNGMGGNQSTFHQSHVEGFHQQAFARQRRYINKMITGETARPPFVHLACKKPLSIQIKVAKRADCMFTNWTSYPGQQLGLPNPNPKIYWVQSQPNETLRSVMESRLSISGLPYQLIDAIREENIYLPKDVSELWTTQYCLLQSQESTNMSVARIIEDMRVGGGGSISNSISSSISNSISSSSISSSSNRERYTDNTSHPSAYREREQRVFIMSGLCGRARGKNTLTDVSEILSHLNAMYEAVNDKTQSSKYAIIAHDDVVIPFDMDLNSLGKYVDDFAAKQDQAKNPNPNPSSNPDPNWAIAFLHSINEFAQERNWIRYVRDKTHLVIDFNPRLFDYWSTKVYIINVPVVRAYISQIMSDVRTYKKTRIFTAKVIAALRRACLPKQCCNNSIFQSSGGGVCVDAERGLGVDSLLPALNRSFIFTIPVFTSNLNHAHTYEPNATAASMNVHIDTFYAMSKTVRKQKYYINEMLQGIIPAPPFLRVACKWLVN